MNPSNRLISVKMTLNHVFYISYLVPASRIRPFLPVVLPPATAFPEHMFVSIVGMKCNNVRLSGFPWPSFDYGQLNVRTYVIDPQTGNPAVYFFQSGVSSCIVPLLTSIFGITWERIDFDLQPYLNEEAAQPSYKVIGGWQEDLYFEIVESESSREGMEVFADPESEITHITGPLIGFMGSTGHTIRFEISHLPLEVHRARLLGIRFQLPVAMGLLKEGELSKPDSVLLVPRWEFTVYLPPRRVYPRS
ncbi:MAG: DUF2071 domain-containing protein [Deltaproteobacteria bacterium]|nr:DUF2071 domain-containing protein [Deltaproteobacteria bacterium]